MTTLRAQRLGGDGPPPEQSGPVPLTHHEILRLCEPFARAGWRVDLAASDRPARRLCFVPVPLPAQAEHPALLQTLVLEAGRGWHLLQRRLAMPGSSLQALAQAEGADPAALLQALQALPPARQWQHSAGHWLALQHRLELPTARTEPAPPPPWLLSGASVQLAGLALQWQVPRTPGMPAELLLQAAPGAAAPPAELPQDLLAVLGLPYSRLTRSSTGWRASVQLRGRGPARTDDALRKLLAAVEHLAAVLAAPPQAYHARHAAARWRASARRGVPLLGCLLLIAASLAVPLLELGPGSVWRMLIFNAPPLLLLWLFTLRELPRIELPPLPRPLPANAWQPSPPPEPGPPALQA